MAGWAQDTHTHTHTHTQSRDTRPAVLSTGTFQTRSASNSKGGLHIHLSCATGWSFGISLVTPLEGMYSFDGYAF